ncbi:BspA family leucine-rich repeat surface protein [Maribacter sp. 4G9]|uniref:BspA family leucine-rich repeat surface protein n=1 Tax=Maribacter sp. 4G9 TaxID=1889777 RepID=UPI000C15BEFC|nr:BspA family leucine-rich repeat surface protein [Maribacter sp. 4G9]PIB26896.1 hypothetical protein BFP75_08215 [Maribacter sp. 4G9]
MFKKFFPLFILFLIGIKANSQSFTSIWNTNNTSSGSSAANEVTIPTNPAYTTYNYDIDWGDGNTDTGVTGNITHTYAATGNYTISITGTFPAIYFNATGDLLKIIEILDWGNIQWQTFENAFMGCENLNFDAINSPDLSQVTNMAQTFRNCHSFNGIMNNWDVSNVTTMRGLFQGASIFNRPLDAWNTISVTDMSNTFNGANAYNEPLDNWNVASVTTMVGMFSGAGNFNQNINNWDVSQVTNMAGTFQATGNFNRPLNNWNVSNVTDMSNMFYSSGFNQPIGNWNVINVTNMSGMFAQGQFNHPIESWNVSNVTNMSNMFYRHRTFNQPLNNWDVSNVTNMAGMFDGWIWNVTFNQPLDSWDVSNVTNMSYMFRDTDNFNQDITGWVVNNVTNMKGMFNGAHMFNQPIGSWDVGSVTDMSEMFQNAPLFNQPLNSWDVSNVTLMNNMFLGALAFDQPLNSWMVDNVTNMNGMFRGALIFNQPLSNWNTANVTNMGRMFEEATTFDHNIGMWPIGNVSNMDLMLSNSGLSQTNYDNTLIGWAAQTVQSNVSLGATNLTYCDGRDARQELMDTHNWNITGDSINCTFVLCADITMPSAGDTQVPANSDVRWNPVPNATGYRVTVTRDAGLGPIEVYNQTLAANIVGVDFTNEFTPGDEVSVLVIPFNDEGDAVGCSPITFTVVESWVNSPAAFKLTYNTTLTDYKSTPANQLRIEANTGYPGYLVYDYSIDWGDGQYNNNVTGTITHTYLTPGIYTVSIIGTFPAPLHYYSNSDSIKLISIDQWGTQPWESMELAFYGCENMEYNATDVPDLSNVASMRSMFGSCYLFNGNIENWDVSNVTDMYGVFLGATDFNQPLNNWDVSNVTNMSAMFLVATSFGQPLNTWDVSNVTNMADMFRQASIFNQNIDNWDVSNVTNMSSMFERAELFNQPLNSWDVGNVTDMNQMFDGFVFDMAFNQPLDNWNVSNVTNMQAMFRRSTAFNQNINSWDVSNVLDMSYMFRDTDNFDQPLNSWNVTEVTNMQSMFYDAQVFDQNINTWNVTNVTNMRSMFQLAGAFNQPLGNWDVNSVVNMQSMFQSASVFNQPLDSWNVSAVANMASMFESAALFNQPLNSWDVSSVTLMNSMFENASVFNGAIGNWNVGSVTNMEAMFRDALVFDQPLADWNTGELLNAREMFRGALAFNQNLEAWNTSFVTTMEAMFQNATSFNQPINAWNVASVTTMQSMLNGATAFNQPLDNWNVRRVTTMQSMFENASAFDQNINTWRVSGAGNMNFMFRNASAFNQPMDQWDLGSVSMQAMFENASAFDQYLGDWAMGNVNNVTNMLNNTALTRINYDNTLIAWSEQNLTPGLSLGAQGLLYCDALEERQSMTDNYGWSFFQDVLDCPIPECTQLVAPLNGAVDVPVNTNLNWEPVLYAREYHLTVGTTPGGNDILNNEVVVNATTYEFPSEFTGGETVYVTIVPTNDTGSATGCLEESFTIASNPPTLPECTQLTAPLNGALDVPVDTDLTWTPVSNADGYRLTIGTSSGGNEILNNIDVGNAANYDLAADLPEDTDIYITIVPYNEQGDTLGCTEESFRTELIPVPPICTNLTSPLSGSTNVPIDTDLTWNMVSGATGYIVNVGITQGGIEIANGIDVGNTTNYAFAQALQANRTHYVTIIPYNEVGDALGCAEENFRTGTSTLNNPPLCTSLSSPLNGEANVALDTNISWNASANTDGYYLSVGSALGASDILNSMDVGNVTMYDLPNDLPENTTIFVTVVPYNSFGSAASCTEESFVTETLPTVPNCTSLTAPMNNATDVILSTNISWNAVSNADGYYLTIGTTSGGNDILDTIDVGNISMYDLATDLPEATTIFVTIVPYNAVGNAVGCLEESFVTETLPTAPNCTNMTAPMNNATDVILSTNISWNAVSGANGYYLTIGTSSGGNDILDTVDVGNVSMYDLATDLPEETAIFVTIIPYNAVGNATGCTEESFTTETVLNVPNCTELSSPLNNATDVILSTDISWTPVANADGYYVTLGTSSGGNDILDTIDVGNVSMYDLATDLPEATLIFVTIVPYNSDGTAMGCSEESFTTETLPTIPDCTSLLTPSDGDINVPVDVTLTWEASPTADGYRLSVGTTSGGTDVVNNEDVSILTSYSFTERLMEDTRYYVTITPYNFLGDAIGCSEFRFTTINQDDTLYGFSPNGDGINDYWTIDGIELHPDNTVSIYNRWGDLVFQIEGYDNQSNVFNGTANRKTQLGASNLPSGTYFFNIQVTGEHNLNKLQGFLVLKR